MMLDYAVWITQGLLAVAAFCAVYRIFRGPSVLDRVISVDVILIIVASMLIVNMVAGDHQDFILFVVVTAVIGFLGAVAIARYVVGRRPEDAAGDTGRGSSAEGPGGSVQEAAVRAQAAEPEAPQASSPETAEGLPDQEEDESTSWFTALARSGFVPKRPSQEEPVDESSVPDASSGSAGAGGRGSDYQGQRESGPDEHRAPERKEER